MNLRHASLVVAVGLFGCGTTPPPSATPPPPVAPQAAPSVDASPVSPSPAASSAPTTPTTPALTVEDDATRVTDATTLFSAKGVAILKGVTRVETFRVAGGSILALPEDSNAKKIGAYPITVTGPEQTGASAKKLADLMLKKDTYYYGNIIPACMFQPGVAYRFWKDTESVDVLVCFNCEDVMVRTPGSKPNAIRQVSFPFAARGALARSAKELFPNDKDIQSLEEKPNRPKG